MLLKKIDLKNIPVVKLIDLIINKAIDMKASDIHIEPFSNKIRIRYRIDGDLINIGRLPIEKLSSIITRIKIMGKMDIAEKRLPQDGRIEFYLEERTVDLRISSLPTIYGEKVVIRILDKNNFIFSKEELGFYSKNLETFEYILKQPYGIILVTGPTGSGKTTTLYSILRELNSIEKNIITIEDPVEYKLKGINQVQVNNKAGLTFANGLRTILRQDPDIIMVGEIRDSETAKIAIGSAITGHLVISTLHTNDTASSIIRLVDMKIEPYLISSAIIGVISQRLVKKLCRKCKIPYGASESEKKFLGSKQEELILYKPCGCKSCNNGFKGRVAVHEILPIDEEIRELINKNPSSNDIRNLAIKNGMISLLSNLKQLALKGEIAFDEVLKVGYTLK
ncbi:GspE/PulE family protein [Anaerosalibacter massiliensis]|uniref:GspE/PulE family protein n=1 Tax=Anaerosalibacter massiliensis TaxID=1347392 RepID=A0A9X2MFV7_9FIRM|nr:GspE/PulE family protein [Anaerosalibacter massiliensis]MCR2042821.1 GspE/PulE family protein [Anaerosalibacter massiliensis]